MSVKHNIRVKGCPYGLNKEDPELPKEVCRHPCDWRINARSALNCSWVLFIEGPEKETISLREMGEMLGMTHENVRTLLNRALEKLPRTEEEFEKLFKNLEQDNVRKTNDRAGELSDFERSLLKLLDR